MYGRPPVVIFRGAVSRRIFEEQLFKQNFGGKLISSKFIHWPFTPTLPLTPPIPWVIRGVVGNFFVENRQWIKAPLVILG